MKKILFAAFIAAIWSCPVHAEDTHESLAEDTLKTFTNLADVLSTIKDTATAEKVKPELKKTCEKLADLKRRFENVGEPTAAKKEDLDRKYKAKMAMVASKIKNDMERISALDGGKDIIVTISEALKLFGEKKKP
jgi:hypothetical protein